ncbi:MAG: trk/ktr system potassium uptake protein [Halanaerobiales bacterium]|nr:trk/ktr system potassium uptake protein [Halanaerobiales bacterium]
MLIIKISDLSPGQILVLGYLIVITTGTLLLLLPVATISGKSTTLLDALFTATSATAVTGLIVVNTAEHWTRFGQTIIMLLVQIGGFGFMTSTTMLFLIFGKKMSLRERLIIMEELNYNKLSGVISLTRYIILLTFSLELIGAILLYQYFKNLMPAARAWYFSIFHAISAFNNAGFDLFGNSLRSFVSSTYINLVISFLFILGGLGFIVIAEIYRKLDLKSLSLHTKLVLTITLFITVFGTVAIFILEYDNPATIGNLSLKDKLLASFFQAVTPRTAGFNTVTIGHFKDVSLFLIILLMFTGASPGSTGGGVKTTTVGTLLIVVYNIALGKEDIEVFGRRLKKKDIFKTLSVVVISLLVIAAVTLVLTFTEQFAFIQIVFEVFSAFGTVGLSTGITSNLTSIGRIFIIITMFIGRVGPFTIALALGKRLRKGIRYPEEDILIG